MLKRLLAPVLVLTAFGLTARADIAVYCDGFGCSAGNDAAFMTAVSAMTFASSSDITFTSTYLSGDQYEDTTNVLFGNLQGNNFTVSGGALNAPLFTIDTLTISVPATYSALALSLTQNSGSSVQYHLDAVGDFANLSSTPTFVGYVNTGGGAWTIQISPPQGSTAAIAVDGFDPAGPPSQGSDTPEVGTLLLIGAGLISMRWMKRLPRRFFHSPQTA